MRKTLLGMAFMGGAGLLVALGCSSTPPDSGTGLPSRNPKQDAEAPPDAGTGYDCTNRAPVDDDPQCDQCARAKCCEYVVKCDESPQCKAAQKCLAECPDGDTTCILGCDATSGAGGEYLRDLGACVTNECENECASAQPEDAGYDSPF